MIVRTTYATHDSGMTATLSLHRKMVTGKAAYQATIIRDGNTEQEEILACRNADEAWAAILTWSDIFGWQRHGEKPMTADIIPFPASNPSLSRAA